MAFGYEKQYGWLIAFTGVTALLGGWGWVWRMCGELLNLCNEEITLDISGTRDER